MLRKRSRSRAASAMRRDGRRHCNRRTATAPSSSAGTNSSCRARSHTRLRSHQGRDARAPAPNEASRNGARRQSPEHSAATTAADRSSQRKVLLISKQNPIRANTATTIRCYPDRLLAASGKYPADSGREGYPGCDRASSLAELWIDASTAMTSFLRDVRCRSQHIETPAI